MKLFLILCFLFAPSYAMHHNRAFGNEIVLANIESTTNVIKAVEEAIKNDKKEKNDRCKYITFMIISTTLSAAITAAVGITYNLTQCN